MKLEIVRKTLINKPMSEIHKIITDFSYWNQWSPWFHCEPTCTTAVQGPAGLGQTQTWDGKIIGSGKQTIEEVSPSRVKTKLEFFKPWKGVSSAIFDLKDLGNNTTEVAWTLDSSLPFFMFFFKNMMMAYMANDFDRGLIMLKELVETGTVISKSVFQGDREIGGFFVVGKRIKGAIVDLPKMAKQEFDLIHKMQQQGLLGSPVGILTLSHLHDIPKGICEFTAGCIYLDKSAVKLPEGFELTEIPKHQGMIIDHFGPYKNLSNPWSMAASHQRVLKKKLSRKIPSYEVYKTMPGVTSEREIHTQIVMPLK